MPDILRANLLSPVTLAFALGVAARLARSEFSLPRDLYTALSVYLLFALGLKGGVELSHAGLAAIARPATATLLLGVITPISAYLVLRRLGRFSGVDAAAVAAHYGSVSAVTFIAASQFVAERGLPLEGFMPTLLTLLESPGIHVALAIGAVQRTRAAAAAPGQPERHAMRDTLREVLTGRTMVLLVGGLVVGWAMGGAGWAQVAPFFDSGFRGALMLFLLEMGIVAAARLRDVRRVGPFLLAFAVAVPVLHGAVGVLLGRWAGLSAGGCTVLAAMAASASYIAAPPAVRAQLPEANLGLSLTASLAMTFPFNLLVGIPLYCWMALRVAGA